MLKLTTKWLCAATIIMLSTFTGLAFGDRFYPSSSPVMSAGPPITDMRDVHRNIPLPATQLPAGPPVASGTATRTLPGPVPYAATAAPIASGPMSPRAVPFASSAGPLLTAIPRRQSATYSSVAPAEACAAKRWLADSELSALAHHCYAVASSSNYQFQGVTMKRILLAWLSVLVALVTFPVTALQLVPATGTMKIVYLSAANEGFTVVAGQQGFFFVTDTAINFTNYSCQLSGNPIAWFGIPKANPTGNGDNPSYKDHVNLLMLALCLTSR